MERSTKRTYRLVIIATLLSTLCFSQIQQDKCYHFAAGVISEYTGSKLDFPIGSAFVIGFAKETYDYIDYGRFDSKDLLATTLGGFALSVTLKLINKPKNEKFDNSIIRKYRNHKRKRSRKKR